MQFAYADPTQQLNLSQLERMRRPALMKLACERGLYQENYATPTKDVLIKMIEGGYALEETQAIEMAIPKPIPLSEAHKQQVEEIPQSREQRKRMLMKELEMLEKEESAAEEGEQTFEEITEEPYVDEASDEQVNRVRQIAEFSALKSNFAKIKVLKDAFGVDMPKSAKKPELVAKFEECLDGLHTTAGDKSGS